MIYEMEINLNEAFVCSIFGAGFEHPYNDRFEIGYCPCKKYSRVAFVLFLLFLLPIYEYNIIMIFGILTIVDLNWVGTV